MFQVIRISPTQAGTAVTSVRPRRRRRRSLPDPVGRRGQAGVSTGGRPRGREERGAAGPAAGRRGRRDHHRHQRRGRDGGPRVVGRARPGAGDSETVWRQGQGLRAGRRRDLLGPWRRAREGEGSARRRLYILVRPHHQRQGNQCLEYILTSLFLGAAVQRPHHQRRGNQCLEYILTSLFLGSAVHRPVTLRCMVCARAGSVRLSARSGSLGNSRVSHLCTLRVGAPSVWCVN